MKKASLEETAEQAGKAIRALQRCIDVLGMREEYVQRGQLGAYTEHLWENLDRDIRSFGFNMNPVLKVHTPKEGLFSGGDKVTVTLKQTLTHIGDMGIVSEITMEDGSMIQTGKKGMTFVTNPKGGNVESMFVPNHELLLSICQHVTTNGDDGERLLFEEIAMYLLNARIMKQEKKGMVVESKVEMLCRKSDSDDYEVEVELNKGKKEQSEEFTEGATGVYTDERK